MSIRRSRERELSTKVEAVGRARMGLAPGTGGRLLHGERLALAGLAAIAAASQASGPRETITFDYTSTMPHTSSGLISDVSIHNPTSSTAAPVPVRKIILVAPLGTHLDPAAVPKCTASDTELEVYGESACPAGSLIGTGSTVTRPLGGLPFTSQVAVFNTSSGQAMLIKFGNGGSAVVRTVIRGRVSTTTVPTCLTGGQPPRGCPADEDAVVSSAIRFPPLRVAGHNYFTTPSICPPSGHWTTRIEYFYADGVADTVHTLQPCRVGHQKRKPR